MSHMEKEIIIGQSRDQLKRILNASVVMMVISIICFFFEGSFYTVVAIAGTCFFGIAFFYTLHLYRKPKKLLVINGEGIWDCSTLKNLGVIPWDKITDVSITECNERKYLSLKCRDMEEQIKSLPAEQEKCVYRNLQNDMEPISILIDMADRRPEEIRMIITGYLEN